MDEELRRKVEKHDCDLYYGNGKDNPSLTTRMALAEGDIEAMKESAEQNRKDSRQIKLMLLAALLTMAADLIAKLVHL